MTMAIVIMVCDTVLCAVCACFGSGADAGWRSHRGSNIIKMQKLMSEGTATATATATETATADTTCEL